jgi:hypothetical protein
MFQVNVAVPILPKAIIAGLFAISRSAVTQTCKKRSVQDDLVSRIWSYISRRITNKSALAHAVQQYSVYLIQDARIELQLRNVNKGKRAGRPKTTFNFTEIKRLIRDIANSLVKSNSIIDDKVTDSGVRDSECAECSVTSRERIRPSGNRPVRKLRCLSNHIGKEAYDILIAGGEYSV